MKITSITTLDGKAQPLAVSESATPMVDGEVDRAQVGHAVHGVVDTSIQFATIMKQSFDGITIKVTY